MGRARARLGFVLLVLRSSSLPAAAVVMMSGTAGGAEKVRIGAVTGNFSNPAVKQMVDAMQAEAKKNLNVELSVRGVGQRRGADLKGADHDRPGHQGHRDPPLGGEGDPGLPEASTAAKA